MLLVRTDIGGKHRTYIRRTPELIKKNFDLKEKRKENDDLLTIFFI